jgi:predicted ester cyclase
MPYHRSGRRPTPAGGQKGRLVPAPDELKVRARRLVDEMFNQGDLAVADELIAVDIIHHRPVLPGSPARSGIEGVKQWVTMLRRAFPDHHAIVEDEIADGDRVVQRITAHGTHEGTYLDLPPTGRQVTYELVEISRAGPDGKFVEHWSSLDLFGLLVQLGRLDRLAPHAPDPTPGQGTTPARKETSS